MSLHQTKSATHNSILETATLLWHWEVEYLSGCIWPLCSVKAVGAALAGEIGQHVGDCFFVDVQCADVPWHSNQTQCMQLAASMV